MAKLVCALDQPVTQLLSLTDEVSRVRTALHANAGS
jgi:hypothetical protein